MGKRKHTDEQKARALELYQTDGPTEAGRQTGIDKSTITRWAKDAGLSTLGTEKTRAATEARIASTADRKARLAADLLDDLERLRLQLFEPCVERKAMAISGGMHEPGRVEIVDIDRDQPTFVEQKQIMTTLAIGVDKVLLMTGEATARIESGPMPDRTPEQEQELAKVLDLVPKVA